MLDKVLESCQYVVSNAKHVKINHQLLLPVADELSKLNNKHWLENLPCGLNNLSIEEIVNFLLIFQSVDFSYWGDPKWTIKTENGNLDGAYAMIYAMVNEYKRNPKFLDFDYLLTMPFAEYQRILEGNIEIPLIKERYDNTISVCRVVKEKMDGNFYQFIIGINEDKDLFEIIIKYFAEVFTDKSIYNDQTIYFYKLAQLLVSDILHIRNQIEGIAVNYSHLVGCADYKIPQVLRALGILEYDEELSSLVNNKIEIAPDSNYEIEIRATSLVAIDLLTKQNPKLYPILVSDLLWIKGRELMLKPYHLTRTTMY